MTDAETRPDAETHPQSHRRAPRIFTPRRLAAGGAVLLASVLGSALLLQNGGSACAAPPSTSASKGRATFYDLGGGMGNCSFPSSPADDLFVALGPQQYSAGAACGTYLDVTGPKGSVRVKVTDQCPECEPGHLDLSRTAFKKIGAEVDGIIPITYRTVADPAVPGPISVRIKEGSSQYWFAGLIDNHGSQLTSVTVAGKRAHRETYNYWVVDSGAGPGLYQIVLTDVLGRSRTLSGITMSPGRTQSVSAKVGRAAAVPAQEKTTQKAAPTSKAVPTSKPATQPPAAQKAAVREPAAPSTAAAAAATTKAAPPAATAVDLAAEPTSCG